MYRCRAAFAALFAGSIVVNACARSNNSGARASPSPQVPAAAESASPVVRGATPVAYIDLSSTFEEKQILDLAALGVFGTPNGTFNPNGTITRGDFVKWLVLANNAIFAGLASKQIRPSQSATSSYTDVSTAHPDFPYVQGMYDAGFTAAIAGKTFEPNAVLTHEQMIAIKESVDRGGVQAYYVANWYSTMPDWKDKNQINKLLRGAIAEDSGLDREAVVDGPHLYLVIDNVPRAFGAVALFRPQEPVTRAQAAAVLWKMGAHTYQIANPQPGDVPRTAADALAPPTPNPNAPTP